MIENKIITRPKKTGKIYLQFDNDKPVPIGELFDNEDFFIRLKSPLNGNDYRSHILFESDGKIFKLFIKSE